MKYLTNSGLSYFLNKIKAYISSVLPTKTSDLTNDSNFIDSSNLKTINNNSLVGTGNITITANTDWNNVNNKPSTFTPSSHTHSASDITSGLATVATSGSYNDLSNKPTIPTVNNATLTIQKNGTTVKTFTANASSNVTANITVPTKTSDLTNDSHTAITMGTDSTSTASPAHGGTFTCIDSVTKDTNGHVTAVNTKTVTLPSDNNTDTKVTQNVSTANENHPILLSVTKDATTNQGAKTSIFASGVKVNPSTGTVTATAFSGNLTGNVTGNLTGNVTGNVSGSSGSCTGNSATATKATNNANGKELTNTIIKGLSISGKTITYTQIDGTTGTLTTQDTNTTYSNFVKSGSGAKAGLVPAPSTTAGTTKYLREDGTWQVPPDHTYNVYNKTLTIQKNGTNVATFTSNSNTDVTANITVPTKTSDLTNDSGFLTSHQDLSGYVPRSGGAVLTSDSLGRSVSTSRMVYCGGVDNGNGASVSLYGKDSGDLAGVATIQAYNGTNNTYLRMFPTGEARYVNNGTTKNLAMAEDVVPRSGGAVISGTTFNRTVNDSSVTLCGGTDWDGGASITLSGKDRTNDNGDVIIRTKDNSNVSDLVLRPNGTAIWCNKNLAMAEDVVPRSGGAVLSGTWIARDNNTQEMYYCGGTSEADGASLILNGKNTASNKGSACIKPNDTTNWKYNWLHPDGTWTWSGTAVQITSDQRLKQQIAEIDDKLLDAWQDVEPVQFKYNDAVGQKGKDKARLHTGYVVQQIDKACQNHGVDISEYGLYCHEEYQERTEEVTIENEDGTIKKETKVIEPAREYYSLRYTEVYAVECAYLRKRIKELEERLEKLEGNSK